MQRLPWNLLEQLTPFHIAWDSQGVLGRVSIPLRKLWQTEESPTVLQNRINLLRPFSGIIQPAWLPELTGLNLQVNHEAKPDLIIRGQVFKYEELWILVGSPNVHSVADLKTMGLKMSDLPIHEGTGDLLIAVETSLTAHRETHERSEQLARANEELRSVNLALSGFVPPSVRKSLGMEEDAGGNVGRRAEVVGRFIEHLQAAIEFRESFLANMSHELRTPLNAILGITEVLQEGVYGTLAEKQKKMLQTVEVSGDHLLALINDVLDLSKIESGSAALQINKCSIDSLCKSAVRLVDQQVRKKGLELRYENRSTRESLHVDRRRIRQVLLNLLSNAAKFTDQGHIFLRVDDMSGEECIRISVEDTGIGIPPGDQEKLFEPFFQVDHGLSRKYQGTGLGLAITLRTVELHGGTVEVKSEPGQGSCFSVILPLKNQRTAETSRISSVETSRRRKMTNVQKMEADLQGRAVPFSALIVDDISDNRTHVVDYLHHRGFSVEVADNGISCLQKIFDHLPDILLLDIDMPGMNGLDVIRCLRAMPATRELPVIALTGSAKETDQKLCRKAGASAFLPKPYKISELMDLISFLLSPTRSHPGKDQE